MPRPEQPEPSPEDEPAGIRATTGAAVSANAAISAKASVPLASRVMPPADRAVRSSAMPAPQPRVYGRPVEADVPEQPEPQAEPDPQQPAAEPSARRGPTTYGAPAGYAEASGYPEPAGYTEPAGYSEPTGYAEPAGYAEPSPRRGPTMYGGPAVHPAAEDVAERPVSPASAPPATGAAWVAPSSAPPGFDARPNGPTGSRHRIRRSARVRRPRPNGPPGFDAPPNGFDAPPRFDAPRPNGPTGFDAPPGFDAAPTSYAPAPMGFEAPPTGYDNPPRGFEAPPADGPPQYPGMGGSAPFGDLLGDRPGAMPGSPAAGSARPSGAQFGQPAPAGGPGVDRFDERTSVAPVVPAPALPAMPPSQPAASGTAAWPPAAAPDETSQNRFDAFKPDVEAKPEQPPTPQVRNGRVLIMVLTAAVLLLAIPLGALWMIGRGGEPAFNPAVGECVKQSGDQPVAVDCAEAGSFTVVSKVATDTECADQAQPKVLISAADGKKQVLCLRPTATG